MESREKCNCRSHCASHDPSQSSFPPKRELEGCETTIKTTQPFIIIMYKIHILVLRTISKRLFIVKLVSN